MLYLLRLQGGIDTGGGTDVDNAEIAGLLELNGVGLRGGCSAPIVDAGAVASGDVSEAHVSPAYADNAHKDGGRTAVPHSAGRDQLIRCGLLLNSLHFLIGGPRHGR